ncbi:MULTISPECIES: hypothetical protein [unclassified Spirosoma]|uniref:hypothetical protein n=1 Tax=unclassified Spirosoma TaxID=2621999 RepID=UPI00095F9D05|nr:MULTISPECIES: hypothetical protein [unclassified Spirosoma]MBN8825543.1 hypothetical protein [Spirosoma sp.]OJW74208.1 MAG: hypothetical protein BGO59_13905 [Spirosoma sp. 48-14]
MNKFIFLILLGALAEQAFAQQQHEGMPMTNKSKADTTKPMDHSMHEMAKPHHGTMDMSGSDMLNHGLTMDTTMGMTHSLSRHLPMNRNGSGTSWHPDNTPMYAYMTHPSPSGWSYMLHYAVYLRYTRQNANNDDKRGAGQQFGAPNWFMGMAQRKVGQRGLFQIRAMISLDPLTVGNGGYPLLFQTGESYKGQPLIDKQHPHDLVSELSVSYSHAFSKDIDLYGYVGYPGEPALGPPAFMHRISAFNLPDAPLSHHWQDATHILFGVATVGFRYKWAKLEGSTFTGREPDENRYNFDKPRFDSYSYRLSINPSPSLALQFSQGFLHSPEDLHPNENVTRTTASILHSKGLGPDRYITSAFVWGRNTHDGEGDNSFLAESSLQLKRIALYGRYENVGKTAEELGIIDPGFSGIPAHTPLVINNLTLGLNYRITRQLNSDLVLGAQVTGSVPDKWLRPLYGKTPISGEIYLRLSPSLMTMQGMSRMRHRPMQRM